MPVEQEMEEEEQKKLEVQELLVLPDYLTDFAKQVEHAYGPYIYDDNNLPVNQN